MRTIKHYYPNEFLQGLTLPAPLVPLAATLGDMAGARNRPSVTRDRARTRMDILTQKHQITTGMHYIYT